MFTEFHSVKSRYYIELSECILCYNVGSKGMAQYTNFFLKGSTLLTGENQPHIWVIDQDGWIFAKFFFACLCDRDGVELHKLAKKERGKIAPSCPLG